DGLQPNLESQTFFSAHALKSFNRGRSLIEELIASANEVVSLADAIQRNGHSPGLRERQLLDLRLIVPVAVRQELDEQTERRTVRGHIDGVRLEERFAAADENMHRPEPSPHVGEHLLPLLEAGRVFLATVLPDVTVNTPRVASVAKHQPDGSG